MDVRRFGVNTVVTLSQSNVQRLMQAVVDEPEKTFTLARVTEDGTKLLVVVQPDDDHYSARMSQGERVVPSPEIEDSPFPPQESNEP